MPSDTEIRLARLDAAIARAKGEPVEVPVTKVPSGRGSPWRSQSAVRRNTGDPNFKPKQFAQERKERAEFDAAAFDVKCATMREEALAFRRTIRHPERVSLASRMRLEVLAK